MNKQVSIWIPVIAVLVTIIIQIAISATSFGEVRGRITGLESECRRLSSENKDLAVSVADLKTLVVQVSSDMKWVVRLTSDNIDRNKEGSTSKE